MISHQIAQIVLHSVTIINYTPLGQITITITDYKNEITQSRTSWYILTSVMTKIWKKEKKRYVYNLSATYLRDMIWKSFSTSVGEFSIYLLQAIF